MNKNNIVTHNLFVYGTLMDQWNVRVITGCEFPFKKATLKGYHKIDFRRAFPFIVPREGDSVEGLIIMGLDEESMRRIDKYEDEGNLYFRQKVEVITESKVLPTFTYVGNLDVIWQHFDIDMEIHERIERFIEEEMESFIDNQILGKDDFNTTALERRFASLEGRAKKECIGKVVKELTQIRFRNPDISTFMTKYGLERALIPSLEWIKEDEDVVPFITPYIKLIVKQVVFNQIEDRVREDFHNKVAVKYPYYEYAISSLIAFSFINFETTTLGMMIKSLGLDQYKPDFNYHDYIVGAIFIANELYNSKKVKGLVDWVHQNSQAGSVPLGVELEFSNIGHLAVESKPGQEPLYDSFYYFKKFDLNRRFWKLGGYVDDHGFVTDLERTGRGFLELALGRYKIVEDTSVPVTQDTWLLSQLINQAVKFMDIRPHSLHVSIQVQNDKPWGRIKGPQSLICLLMLGGDIQKDTTGGLREKRIYQKEIINVYTGLTFSRLNYHKSDELAEKTQQVVEYQFPRLFYEHNYEPLILALKGYQLARNPYILNLSKDCPELPYHKEIARHLIQWAKEPKPVSEKDINNFLKEVKMGLENERKTGSGHGKKYIDRMIGTIEERLIEMNNFIKENSSKKGSGVNV